ncbi:NTP transferase domain-containing protein [Azospirillum sp. B21]|uniref:sugar phosphate nucleotidyltransferase n=1 Tax=Azospirillum sp. B21 TaxID=2607496 RepID=UPI0011EBC5F7|nr:sugar phosphate nucleotidyltransferase [Azospirillum sp. B21]KAA0577949.1 NTP transferase domain-containing protein [Azospirillum sp. B21]
MKVSRQCVILVGGLGTRLGSLVKDRPKPLLDVGGIPFVDYLIRQAVRFGFDDIVLLAGYQAEIVHAFVNQGNIGAQTGARIRVVVEQAPLGTGGALHHARELLADEFLMMNGDSMFDFNLLDLATRSLPQPCIGRLALRSVPDATRFGLVKISGSRIINFHERPKFPGPGIVNGGVYYIKKDILKLINNFPCSIERDVFPRLALEGLLAGLTFNGYFVDIGIPEDLVHTRRELPERRQPAVFFDSRCILEHGDDYCAHQTTGFRWRNSAKEAIKQCNDNGCLIFVMANQPETDQGYYDMQKVIPLYEWMESDLRQTGGHIDAFRYRPQHLKNVVDGYAVAYHGRMPQPGTLQDILSQWPVNKEQSLFLSSNISDLELAKSAGLRPCLFENFDAIEQLR